jgi:hypothetical protein
MPVRDEPVGFFIQLLHGRRKNEASASRTESWCLYTR